MVVFVVVCLFFIFCWCTKQLVDKSSETLAGGAQHKTRSVVLIVIVIIVIVVVVVVVVIVTIVM